MARITKEYDVRRGEILDTAQAIFYRKGYEQAAIQDIIDAVGIAKGTFYHYFRSKQDLTDAMVERMFQQTADILTTLISDQSLTAVEKFQAMFDRLISFKQANKQFYLQLMEIWYTDENAILRHKVKAIGAKLLGPFVTALVQQGVEEDVFTTPYPDLIGEIILQLWQGLSDKIAEMLLHHRHTPETLAAVNRKIGMYEYAIERMLDAPDGSLKMFDIEPFADWFDESADSSPTGDSQMDTALNSSNKRSSQS